MTIGEITTGIATWRLTRARTINLGIGLVAVLVYEFAARPIYRPYIYGNHINDFHLADTIGNSLGTIAAIFVVVGLIGQGRTQHLFIINTIIISFLLYEIAHPLLGKSMDPWDLLATVLTGGLCMALYKAIHPAKVESIN